MQTGKIKQIRDVIPHKTNENDDNNNKNNTASNQFYKEILKQNLQETAGGIPTDRRYSKTYPNTKSEDREAVKIQSMAECNKNVNIRLRNIKPQNEDTISIEPSDKDLQPEEFKRESKVYVGKRSTFGKWLLIIIICLTITFTLGSLFMAYYAPNLLEFPRGFVEMQLKEIPQPPPTTIFSCCCSTN